MTNKGEFDTNDSLETVLEKVSKGGLLELDRGEVSSRYQGEACVDAMKVYLDLSVVEIYGYSTHQITMENKVLEVADK